MLHRITKSLTLVFFLLSQFLSIGFAYAQDASSLPITPDGTTSTFVTQTASGIDQINIAAPNSSGLSHNKFENYNVNSSGQILNNFSGAANDVVSTQIGGLVTANPNLNSGSASIILNEVTSNNISQLLGYVEIAGGRADLIIANPNGITCAGCGFINVSRLGIIGGKSEFDSNGHLGFNLTETANTQLNIPIITISGLGLDATTTTSADIIASGVKLISSIYGSETGDLTIKTGDGKYDYATKLITPNFSSSTPIVSDTPLFAIDASSLAKIQSGRIFLIATKEGLGVNMAAEILAGNKVQIDANGDVYYANITAGTEVDLKSTQKIESLSSSAKITSPTLTISSDELNNLGFLTANHLSLNANSLNNYGLIYGEDSLNISGTNLTNSGTIFSPEDYAIALTGTLTNSGLISSTKDQQLSANSLINSGEISAKNLSIIAASSITNSNKILANEDLNISATNLSNDSSGIISSLTKSLTLTFANDLENSGELSSAIDLSVNSQSLNNSGTIYSANNQQLTTTSLTNSGTIQSSESLTLATDYLTNSGLIYGENFLGISGASLNNSGTIFSPEDYAITLTESLTNSGLISSTNSQQLTANSLINSGEISANNLTFLITNYLTNSGSILSASDQQLTANNLINSGLVQSGNDSTFNLSSLTNSENSSIYSAKKLTLNLANSLANYGEISALENLSIDGISAITNSNNILSGGTLQITANNLTNNSGATISSLADSLTLTLGNDLQNSGELGAQKNLSITSNNLTNSGDILALNELTISAINSVDNSGNFQSAYGQYLTSKNLTNSGIIKSFGSANISADTIGNQANATILATGDVQITANNSLTNAGNILGNSKLNLASATTNNSGEIFSDDDLTLTLTDLLTNSGSINSSNYLTLSSSSNITNSNQIFSGKNLKITATNLTNSSDIKSGGDLNLGLSNLTNSGNIASSNDLEIIAANSIINSSTMQSGNSFTSNSSSFTNSPNSLILASANLAITAANIFNQNTKPTSSQITSGLVSTGGNITLKTDNLNNNSGIIAAKSTSLSALNNPSVTLLNDSGSFISTAAILLNLGNLDYKITGEVTASNIDITASNITNQGSVTASDYIKLNATGADGTYGTIVNGYSNQPGYVGDNSSVKLLAGSYIDLVAKGVIDNYATIQANGAISLASSGNNVTNYGAIQSGNDVVINAVSGTFKNANSSSLLTSNNDLRINANFIDNYGEISAARNQQLTANNLTNNPTALIWSGNDLTLNVANSLINNQADIYANRNLTIQKNSSSDPAQNKTVLVQNISGNIETYNGDIIIKAATLANQRSAMKTQSYVFTSWHRGYYGHEDHYYSSYIASFSGAVGLNSSIVSGGNLDLNLNTLSNNSSSILVAKNIGINAANIGNVSNLFEAYQNVNNDWWCRCGNAINNYLIAYKPTGAAYTSESYPAFIKSGGSLTITQNNADKTSSFLNGNNVAQNSSITPASKQSSTTTINKIDTYTLAETGIVNIDLTRFINAINASNSLQKPLSLNQTPSTSSPISTVAITPNTSNNSDPNLNPTDPKIIYTGLYKITFNDNPNKPLIEARSEFTDQSKFFGSAEYFKQLGLDPKQVLGDLDRQSRTENNIPTKQLGDSFTEQKLILDQINSLTKDSLLLSKSNANQEAEVKAMIASAVSEFNRLGLDATKVATKGLSKDQANSLTSDIITFETTTLNGINVLAPKIYLSLDTRNRLLANNKLASDSTIYAKDNLTINAENILSAGSITSGNNLNLSSNNSITLTNASLSSGNKLSLNAKGDISISNNLAKLQAVTLPTRLVIASASVAIQGNSIQSNNLDHHVASLLAMTSKEDTLGVTISSTASIPTSPTSPTSSILSAASSLSTASLAAANKLKNDAATARSAAIFSAGTDIEITSGGSINIANNYSQAGGSIFMTAAKDINNSNYTVQADNNIVMNATNINNISTATTAAIAETTPTKIEAGSMVSLNAQKDSSGNGGNITNLGATIKGGELVYLTAANNITNKALIDYKINGSSVNPSFTGDAASYLTSLSSTEDLITASSAKNIRSTLVSQGVIESGGDVVLVANNDINNQGSKVTSAGSTLLEATNGDVNITTSILRDRTVESGGKKKNSWTRTTDATTNLGSEITSGGDIFLTSGASDINITGSKLTSSNNTELTAANDVNISAAQNTAYNSFSSSKKGITSQSNSSSISGSTTNILSELTAGENLSITTNAGDINLIGTKLSAANADINAAKELNIYAVADSSYSQSTRSRSNGLGGITSAILTPIGESLVQGLPISGTLLTGDLSSSSAVNANQKLTNQLANINVVGNLALTSNSNMNLIGTSLSGASASLTSTFGDINIANVKDSEYNYSDSNSSRVTASSVAAGAMQYAFALTSSGLTLLNPTSLPDQKVSKIKDNYDSAKELPQRQETHLQESQNETIIASALKFGSLAINSSKDSNITSSNLTTTSGNLSIISGASGSGSTNILTATENDFTNSFDSKKSPSIYAAIGNGITQTFNAAMPNFGHSGSDETSNNKLEELAYDTDSNRISTTTGTNIASNLNSSGNLNITSASNNLISGSILDANNINLTATNGTTIITSVADTSSTSTSSTAQDYADASLDYNRGRVSANSNSKVVENTANTNTATQKQSELTAANNITILSKDDLSILSSNLTTDAGAISLTSREGDVNILALSNTTSSTSETKTGTQTLSAGIGNAHIDTAYAADDLVKAGENLKDAKTDLNHMETLYKNGQADKEAVEDSKANLAIAYLNLVLAEVKLAASATKSAAAAESLYTGFYADLRLSIEGTKTNSSSNTSTAVASNIFSNGNLNISAGMSGADGNTTVTGSSLISQTGDINITSKGNTVINASKDTYNSSTKTKSWTENLTLASSAGSGSGAMIDNAVNALQVSLGLAMSKSKSDTSSTTYNNSQLTANSGSIKINSLNNATFSGANLLAENIELNTVGDLTVESLQNSYKQKGSSFGMNLGGGAGSQSGSGNASLGLNYSSNKTDRLWTDNQTSILGTKSVIINTKDNTNLKGSVIANITNIPDSVILAQAGIQEFLNSGTAIDGNNLTLNTNSLTFANLSDHEYSQSSGFGISTNIGRGSNNTNGQGSASASNPNQQTNYYPNGSTTLSAQNSGYKKEQTTFATLGSGDITTNSTLTFDSNGNVITNTGGTLLASTNALLTGLNRDITNSQVMTKDTITNALNVDITIDNRLIAAAFEGADYLTTKDEDKSKVDTSAWDSLKNDQKNLGKNVKISAEQLSELIAAVPGSPVWASRVIDGNNNEVDKETGKITYHPAPNLWTGIWADNLGQAKEDPSVGRNDNGCKDSALCRETISDEAYHLKALYYGVPGFKSFSQFHDAATTNADGTEKSGAYKFISIFPYIPANYCGAIGTILDAKNWNKNSPQNSNNSNTVFSHDKKNE